MAAQHSTSSPRRTFPQRPEDHVDHARRRPVWPDSVHEDQRAVEQARRELGPDADPKQILARAQQIAQQSKSTKQEGR